MAALYGGILSAPMRARLRLSRTPIRLSPERYFVVASVALVALTLIVFTGAAVRVTGSGLGCPNWPQCYKNGRLVAELNSHAWIEFGNRMFTGFVALAAIAAGFLAFFRTPFRRDLAVLGVLLPLGVIGQAVMGGLTVLYGLAPGWVMGHYLLSMTILVAAGALAWRSRPSFERGEEPAADRATARAVWALFVLGAVTIFVGTAATAGGPHAGGSGTGDVVHRFSFRGASTATWLIDRHGVLAAALGVLAVVTWWLARRRDANAELRLRLTRICLLLAAQGVIGITQFQLDLPAEIVWVHVALATLLWVGIVLAAMQVGAPSRAPAGGREVSARAGARASAARS
jgi:heme a synthase